MDDFEKVFAALNKQRPDGLYALTGGPVMRPNGKRIVGFALKSRLPSTYTGRDNVRPVGSCPTAADLRGQLPARGILRGQNLEGRQACRSAGRAANEV